MSLTTATNATKQRKLSDLRVLDLQRELRSFGIPYDKKELKVSLVEKLKQALLHRNYDPDLHLFDTTTDLKAVLSDENNRSLEENGSQEMTHSETSRTEIDSEGLFNSENSVQTRAASSSKDSTTPTLASDMDDDQSNRMDTMDLRQLVEDREDANGFATIEPTSNKKEDENNNDEMNSGLTHRSQSPSDEQLDTQHFHEPSTQTNTHLLDDTTAPINEHQQQQTASEHHRADEQQTTTATERTTDDATLAKSNVDGSQPANDQQKKENTRKPNKDQCHLWVSNIAKETHASDLKDLFSKHGKVLTTKVIGSSSAQWFGYINLATPDDVEKCINALHLTELHGKKIHVDSEMHDQSSSSKSKPNTNAKPSYHPTSSNSSSYHQSASNHSSSRRDPVTDPKEKSLSSDTHSSSNKRPASATNDAKKKLSTSDVHRSDRDEKAQKSHDSEDPPKKSGEAIDDKRRSSSSSNHSPPSRYHSSRVEPPRSNDKTESSHKSTVTDRKNDRNPMRSDSSDGSKLKNSSSSASSHRSHSNERRSTSSSTRHRSSSTDRSRQPLPSSSSHSSTNRYDKPKESSSKDHHRSTASTSFDNDRRSMLHNEQRLRQEKALFERKQLVQQHEEEKIKEQQRRLAEERERVKHEFEILERERLEIERTRLALEKEKQNQARELEKQQRRLADEAKQRQQELEAKLRDEKLHRLAHDDNKRPRTSHHDSPRSQHPNKAYDRRSPPNTSGGHARNRAPDESDRDYYPEPKRQYTNNQREVIFRDRAAYRDSDLPMPSSSMAAGGSSQRFASSSSNAHRPSDPYGNLPPRGRDMALPPSSSVGAAYERSARPMGSSPTNTPALPRRPNSRERFENRDYRQGTERRDRSPPSSSKLHREPIDSVHWERPKPRDPAHYSNESHKYAPHHYLSEPSSQSNQQQGLWSSAPPSRQAHHHADLPVKPATHAPSADPYSWQHLPQQAPHHPSNMSSSHDRSRANLTNNPRIPMLSSSQPPPPAPLPSSSRGGGASSQTHLYNHGGVPVNTLSSSQQQQHVSLAPPPSLHHATAYLPQQIPPSGLVLHSTGPTRAYEPHYIVTQSLPPQRRY